MPSTTLLLGFVAASLVVLLIPGPGVLYVVARSVMQGPMLRYVSGSFYIGLGVNAALAERQS